MYKANKNEIKRQSDCYFNILFSTMLWCHGIVFENDFIYYNISEINRIEQAGLRECDFILIKTLFLAVS